MWKSLFCFFFEFKSKEVMKSNFSEFTYGYALTEEFIYTLNSVIGVPIFPSLIDEGRSGGYDVKFRKSGIPLFLQFKLSSYMKRNNAKEIKKYHLYQSAPIYRMKLRPLRYSQQHNQLLDLENKGNEVYYVCPKFHTNSDIDNYYTRKEIIDNSVFIRPTSIGILPDDKTHHVAFRKNDNYGYLLSEPKKVKGLSKGYDFTEELIVKLNRSELSMERQLMITYNTLKETLNESHNIKFQNPESSVDIAKSIAYLSRAYLDAEFFILTNK